MNEPLLSATATLNGEEVPTDDAHHIRERLERELDLVLDGGSCGIEATTVIDLTGAEVVVVRAGKGDLSVLGTPT